MDGSKRSSTQCYFTGSDARSSSYLRHAAIEPGPAQIESVLAHELPFQLKHIPSGSSPGCHQPRGVALLGWLSRQEWFYAALGVPARSDAAALLLFLLACLHSRGSCRTLAAWSRRHDTKPTSSRPATAMRDHWPRHW